VGPRNDLDDVERKRSYPNRDSNFDPLAVQAVASRYTDYATPAPASYRIIINILENMYK
jgi:hypothetical protein